MAVRTVHIGVGRIGRLIAIRGAQAGLLEPVCFIDASDSLKGRFLGEIEPEAPIDLAEQPILDSLDEAWPYLEHARQVPVVAILATCSRVPEIVEPVLQLVRRGLHVVSTCEELACPWLRYPDLARQLDEAASASGVAIVGTGVNPGFIMDLLPAVLLQSSVAASRVEIERVVDASNRREALQRKIGVGMNSTEFRQLAASGKIGHVGLAESAALVATALTGEVPSQTDESIEPVIADEPVQTEFTRAEPGQVRGVEQHAQVTTGDVTITLRLRMAIGEPESFDRVRIDGKPPVNMTIRPGLHGDEATAACAARAAVRIPAAPPGLRSVLDLPIVPGGVKR